MLDLANEITHFYDGCYGLGWEVSGQRHCGRVVEVPVS